jgi:drug/metabolite transporter (DMT)-like permease
VTAVATEPGRAAPASGGSTPAAREPRGGAAPGRAAPASGDPTPAAREPRGGAAPAACGLTADARTLRTPAGAPGVRGAVALGCAGAAGYGVTVVIGRELARDGLEPATALGIRFAIAAAVLGALLGLRGVPRPAPRAAAKLLALGAIGYAGQSTLFYLSLQRGTAATSILLFYAYPPLVCLIGWVALGERRPCRRTCLALALSAGGTALVASAGPVEIDPLAVLFALSSALVFALYVLAGQRLAGGIDAITTAAVVAAGAALGSAGRGALTHSLQAPGDRWTLLVAYGLFTAAAFTLMFAALGRLGARRTSVVMTLEAVFAVGLATLVLGEPLTPAQAAGGACVLAATTLVARIRAG